ncbi:WPP domain-interacting tail-anchored protein 1 [Bienertia sinuspersici]
MRSSIRSITTPLSISTHLNLLTCAPPSSRFIINTSLRKLLSTFYSSNKSFPIAGSIPSKQEELLMGVDACVANGINDADCGCPCNSLSAGVAFCDNGKVMTEPTMIMDLLMLLEMDVAYFSEKLVNLEHYMTIIALGEVRLGELSMAEQFYLRNSEMTELGSFLDVLLSKLIDARFGRFLEAFARAIVRVETDICTFPRTISFFRETNTAYSMDNEDLERTNYDTQIAGQQRLVLKMLEKSLATELNLEKQLLESRKREEDLKSKLVLKNEVASSVESLMGVALERLLEAEYASHIFRGIAKEMISRLQIYEFNMHCLRFERRGAEIPSLKKA